jgi:hypothetical protein
MGSVPDSSVPSAEREPGITKTDEVRRLKNARNREFESISLQRRVQCEPELVMMTARAPVLDYHQIGAWDDRPFTCEGRL